MPTCKMGGRRIICEALIRIAKAQAAILPAGLVDRANQCTAEEGEQLVTDAVRHDRALGACDASIPDDARIRSLRPHATKVVVNLEGLREIELREDLAGRAWYGVVRGTKNRVVGRTLEEASGPHSPPMARQRFAVGGRWDHHQQQQVAAHFFGACTPTTSARSNRPCAERTNRATYQ